MVGDPVEQDAVKVVDRYHPELVILHWILAAMVIASLTLATVVLAPALVDEHRGEAK
jgi:hypothetical protein